MSRGKGQCGAGWFVLPKGDFYDQCCEQHDLAYEAVKTPRDRMVADLRFLACMSHKIVKYEEGSVYWLMFLNYRALAFFFLVRMFGWMFVPKNPTKKQLIET